MRTSPPHGPCGVVTAYPSASLLGRISGSMARGTPKKPSSSSSQSSFSRSMSMVRLALVTSVTCRPPCGPPVRFHTTHVSDVPKSASPRSAAARSPSTLLQQPLQLAAGEVGGRGQPGLAPDDLAAAVGVQGGGDAVGAGVLPDDGVVPRTAGMPVPDDRRLALVGDADGVQVGGAEAGAGEGGPDDGLGALPDLQRVVLDPPGAGEDLLVLELVLANRPAGVVEDHEAGARRALVDGAHEVSHGLSLAQRAGVVLATVTRLASVGLRCGQRRSVLGRRAGRRRAAGTSSGGRRRGLSPRRRSACLCRCVRPVGSRRAAAGAARAALDQGGCGRIRRTGRPGVSSDLDLSVAGLREGGNPASGLGGHGDQPLVLELVERRVDRSGARGPAPVAALGDRLHELVAVHGLVRQQQQDRCADVAASHPSAWASAATSAASAPARAAAVR